MKKYIKSVISLISICLVVSLLLAITNLITAPTIKKNEDAAANAALLEVLPDGEDFERVDISKYTLPSSVEEAYCEKNGGYVFKLRVSGYSPDMIIMCGISSDGRVSGALCLSSGETLGYEQVYGDNFKGKSIDEVETVDVISGATKTTSGYRSAIKDALNAFTILNGGSVDIRTEEEILADNLSAALPSADGKFSSVFITEVLDGIDAVYKADNGSGYVYVSGEDFYGLDSDGVVVAEDISEEIKSSVEASAKKLMASKITELDISGYDELPSEVISVSKTQSGNTIFQLRASGYGINGQYHASGEYIKIRISMSKTGKIIACETVSQAESEGYGAACAEYNFYSQFNGKDESNYENIDAISGATVTTNGYKNAVKKAFDALKIIEGRVK